MFCVLCFLLVQMYHVGLSENVGLIFPIIDSHLIGIMISKTIGFIYGTLFSDTTMYISMYFNGVFQWWTAFQSARRFDSFLFKNFLLGRSRKSNPHRFPSLLVFKTRQNPRLNKFSMSGIYQIYQNFKTVSNITRDMYSGNTKEALLSHLDLLKEPLKKSHV